MRAVLLREVVCHFFGRSARSKGGIARRKGWFRLHLQRSLWGIIQKVKDGGSEEQFRLISQECQKQRSCS